MMQNPKHSIIFPNYNEKSEISQTLDSLLQQTFKDFEVLVIDDGSTDGSSDVIAAYANQDTRIIPLYQLTNQGVFNAVLYALERARGSYISLISSGDVIYPSFLQKAHAFFNQYPHAKLWSCHIDLFRNLEKINTNDPSCFSTSSAVFFLPETLTSKFRSSPLWIHGMAAVMHKQAIKEHGGFVAPLGPHADFYLLHKIALHEGMGYCPEFLGKIQISDHSYSRAIHLDRKRRNTGYWVLLRHIYKEPAATQQLFLQAGLLTFISDTLFWKLIWQPKYWRLLRASKSSTIKRIIFSVLKKLGFVQHSRQKRSHGFHTRVFKWHWRHHSNSR